MLKRLPMPADPQNVAVVGARWAVVVSPRAGAVTVVSLPSRVWVSAADRRFVTVFDSQIRRPVARIPAGAPPQHVAIGYADDAFITSGYGSSLEIVDRSSGRIRRTVRVP